MSSPSSSLVDLLPSSCFTHQHQAFREKVRNFVKTELTDEVVEQCEREGGATRALIKKSYQAGLYAMRAPLALGGTPPIGIGADGVVDALYELILVDELSACGAHGLVTELIGNFGMLLPILDAFATDEMRAAIIRPMIQADVFACFAFTEPPPTSTPTPNQAADTSSSSNSNRSKAPAGISRSPGHRAGSGGPRMRTRATKSADGFSYELTGEKMFISFGARSDYIVTACQIADSNESTGPAGLSLLLVPSQSAGVTITPMRLHGWHSTSTTRIRFDKVRVPAHLLLVDGGASSTPVLGLLFHLLQSNVNQERFVTAIMANRSARVCIDAAIEFARSKRIPNERRLIDSQAVRQDIVHMAMMVQQNTRLLESLAVHMAAADHAAATTSHGKSAARWSNPLSQQTALVKYACTHSLTHCAQVAGRIVGMSALACGGGLGGRIERIKRDAAVSANTGGNENVLAEFVAKRAKL